MIHKGDGWEVRQGDSLSLLTAVMSDSVDCVVTDCPYSSGGAFRGDRSQTTKSKYVSTSSRDLHVDFAGDNRDQRSFGYWCALWYGEVLRAAKPGALIFSFTDWRQLPVSCDSLQAGGWVWRGVAAWDKTLASRPQSGRPRAQCEFVIWGSKGPHKAHAGAPVAPGFWSVRSPRDSLHIAQKPVSVLRDLVRLAPPDGLILDPFCGAGSTGVAALREGRRALLFELVPDTATLAAERLRAEEQGRTLAAARVGQRALPLTDGAKS